MSVADDDVALAGDEALHSALASIPGVSVIVFDHAMRLRALHGTALQRHGYVHERMLGKPANEVLRPAVWERLHPLVAQALAGRSVTIRQRSEDASAVYESTFSPVHRGGRVVAATMTSRDITEQAVVENVPDARELAAARELFEATFAAAPIGMLISRLHDDGTTAVVESNAAFARMLGRRPDELLGDIGPEIVHPDDHVLRKKMIANLLAGRPAAGELRFLHRDGHDVWALTSPSMTTGPEGEQLIVVQALDISERKIFEARLQHLADRDALTGLFSRRRFDEELIREVSRVRRHRRPAALLALDLDGFKAVNDSFGHAAGDEVLIRLADALREIVRETDILARIGGDEFALILPDTDEAASRVVAAKLIAAVRANGRVLREGRRLAVTASIGITSLGGRRGVSAEQLMVEADLAMYRAKAAGKDGICFHEPPAARGAAA